MFACLARLAYDANLALKKWGIPLPADCDADSMWPCCDLILIALFRTCCAALVAW